jgi:hypothetical protein
MILSHNWGVPHSLVARLLAAEARIAVLEKMLTTLFDRITK